MATTPQIGLGIIGCGHAAQRYHAPALRRCPGLLPVALFDPDAAAALALSGMLPGTKPCASVEEVLHHRDVQAVAILSPPSTHFALASQVIAAGKHVLVEKPLSLEAAQADRLLHMAEHSGLICGVGFHLRNHRDVGEARMRIRRGEIGRVRVARSLWCAAVPAGLPKNSWRRNAALGGTLLDDVAVHHLDLLAYLLGSPLRDPRVAVSDLGQAGSHLQLSASTEEGVAVEMAVVEGRFEWQEVEVVGERGRIRLPLYDAWGFDAITHRDPVFGLAGRLHRTAVTLRRLPEGLLLQLRGGHLAECYRAQWERFAAAILGDGQVAASFADGAAVAHLIAAAQRRSTHEILLRPRAHTAPAEPEAAKPQATFAAGDDMVRPPLSVVLATPDSFRTLRTTVRYLRAQTAREQMEVVLVGPHELSRTISEAELAGFGSFQVVNIEEVRTIAQANAAGARAARGRIIAFGEDHCFPEPGWAQALMDAHQEEYAVVGPVVKNANPATWVSWADFLAGYGPWMEGKPAAPVGFLPGHNSSYKRELLESLGPTLEEELEAETVLHLRLTAEGHRLHSEARAVVAHVNFSLMDSWVSVQFLNGRMFAGMRCREWGAARRLLYFAGSPLLPFLRTARSLPVLMRTGLPLAMKLEVLPGIFLGMCMDGMGQMLGYAAGPGRARSALARLEFHRSRHVTPEEREALFV